ncbi:hypothetical protein ACP4OV_010849 [Aristida adscensionis]
MSTGAPTADEKEKPAAHAVFFPFPAQGHVAPALHLAKLLHLRRGVRITFVHTERNRRRLLRSRGAAALAGAPGFRFAVVPDGLPPPSGEGGDDDDGYSLQDMVALLSSIKASVPHLKNLLDGAAASGVPATCVVSDIDCVLHAAREAGLPAVAFWTTSACGLLGSMQCRLLMDKGLIPLKEEQLTNGYLDSTVIDWLPGMPKDMRMREFVSFIRTTDPDDPMLSTVHQHMESLQTIASAVVLNTFDDLEGQAIAALAPLLPAPIYTVGPLQLLAAAAAAGGTGSPLETLGANLFTEDDGCLGWLGSRRPRSVVYANFGSIVVLTSRQLVEVATGLANSGYEFLLVIRDDLAKDFVMIQDLVEEAAKERCYVARWCPQDAVLRHEAIGAFVTHCGWNSILESISAGVPMLCWPFGADQPTNCRFACTEWHVGMKISAEFERGEVEARVREVMGGEKGMEMRRRAAELRERAAAVALLPDGRSWVNLDRLVTEVI